MRRLAVLLALLPAAPAQAAPVCGPAAATTMAAAAVTRVYVERDEVYACTRGVRRRRHLGTQGCDGAHCATLDHAAVAGRMVAYAVNADDSAAVWFEVTVRDMRTGRRLERQVSSRRTRCGATGRASSGARAGRIAPPRSADRAPSRSSGC